MATTSFLINPLSIYEHIKTKQKINFLDSHHYLPWVLLSDKDHNVIIYDVNKKHIIRAFSLTQYLPEDIKIKGIIDEAVDNDDVILFIDELHLLAGAGSAEGSMDAANILKPALARNQLKLIGATTLDEYRKNIEKDKALLDCRMFSGRRIHFDCCIDHF